MKKKNTVIGSALAVMIVVLCSKFLGFVRETIIASSYGANINTDIYFISIDFMINLSGALFASLTTALVTMYIDMSVKSGKKEADSLASKMVPLFFVMGLCCSLLVVVLAPYIAKVLAPTYNEATSAVLTGYLRLFSLIFLLTSLQTVYAAVLNANNSFVPGKLYGIVFNPIAIMMALLFAAPLGINALVIAYFLANIVQTVLLALYARKHVHLCMPHSFNDGKMKQLVVLALPLLCSNVLMQVNGWADKAICSALGEGFPSNLTYAYNLEQFVTATFTATLSLILLSKYATYVAEGDAEKVEASFKESLGGLCIVLLPITLITCIFSYDIVSIVYLRGKFDSVAALRTSQALVGFAIGFLLIALREMYIRLHFSYQNTKMPMIANISGVFVNVVLSIVLGKYVGIFGVSVATSLSALVTIYLLNRSVKQYLPKFRFLSLSPLFLKLFIAAGGCALIACICNLYMPGGLFIKFVLSAFVSLVTYVLLLLLVRCREFTSFIITGKNALLTKIKNKKTTQ